MPGVLILEAMAQTGGLAFQSSFEKEEEGIPVLARIEEFRFWFKWSIENLRCSEDLGTTT